MNELTDQDLLQDYAERQSEPAFAELVRRHIDFVYSAAPRMVCDSHTAEDVTQNTFIALTKSARQVRDRSVLSSWLHSTARNLAANAVRTEVRRRAREQEVAAMNELLANESDAVWKNIAPHLDDAIAQLGDSDRDALLLRYFERKSAREMSQIFGTSEEAAQKRVNRAVERLRKLFAKRGVAVGAGGLAVLISAHAVQAAPPALPASISSAAALAGTTLHTSTAIAATKIIAMTTFQKVAATAAIAVLAGAGIYEARQASQLRAQVQTLQQAQIPLISNLAKLQTENKQLSNLVSQEQEQKSLSQSQFDELLRLRGQSSQAKATAQEFAKLKSTVDHPGEETPSFVTNALALGIAMGENGEKTNSLARLARMKEQLRLTDDQEKAINDVIMKHLADHSQRSREKLDAMMQHKTPPQAQSSEEDSKNEEIEIEALLTPDQLAAYPNFSQSEATTAADNSAKSQLAIMAAEMDLSQEQQDKIHAALYQLNLNGTSAASSKDAIAQARAIGDYSEVIKLQIEVQKQSLAEKIKALDGILTPEQLTAYKQKQLNAIEVLSAMLKMFLPRTINTAAP